MSRAKTEYMYLNRTPIGSVNMQSVQLPPVTEFKYMGSTLHSDGGMSTENHMSPKKITELNT